MRTFSSRGPPAEKTCCHAAAGAGPLRAPRFSVVGTTSGRPALLCSDRENGTAREFAFRQTVQHCQIDHPPGDGIHRSAHGQFHLVIVPVSMGVVAFSEGLAVLFRQSGVGVQPVRCGESVSSAQPHGHYFPLYSTAQVRWSHARAPNAVWRAPAILGSRRFQISMAMFSTVGTMRSNGSTSRFSRR